MEALGLEQYFAHYCSAGCGNYGTNKHSLDSVEANQQRNPKD